MHDYGDASNPADTGVADIIKDGMAGLGNIYGDDEGFDDDDKLISPRMDHYGASQEMPPVLNEEKPKKKSKKDKKKKEDKA